MPGSPERIAGVAEDIVTPFEGRLEALDGEGMIVTMSRRIAYAVITQLRPNRHTADDGRWFLKGAKTGSAVIKPAGMPMPEAAKIAHGLHFRIKGRGKFIQARVG